MSKVSNDRKKALTVGPFQLKLLRAMQMSGEGHSVTSLHTLVNDTGGENVSFPQVSTAAKRLREKGLLQFSLQPSGTNRPGAPSKVHTLTQQAEQLLLTVASNEDTPMPTRERMLGPIQLVLLCMIEQKNLTDTSGDTLHKELTQVVSHEVSAAQVYIALRRLKERGLLVAHTAPATGKRGKPKVLYTLTALGAESLAQYQKIARYVAQTSSAPSC